MMESLLKTWSQSFKLEEGRRTPKGWRIEREEVRCIAQFAVWQKWLQEPGSLQSQGQSLGGGEPGGQQNAGMTEGVLVTTWLYISQDSTPHDQPGYLGGSPGRQGSKTGR